MCRLKLEEFKKDYCEIYKNDDQVEDFYSVPYQIYVNAYYNMYNFCVFGRIKDIESVLGALKLRRKEAGVYAQLQLVDETDNKNTFYITDEHQKGNVLCSGKWSIGANDAWVLGGIHGGSTFNFVYNQNVLGGKPLTLDLFMEKYIIQSQSQYPITVTGRELFGLKCAKYTPVFKNDTLVLSPSYKSDSVSMTLKQYDTNLKNFEHNMVEELRGFLKPAFDAKP